MKAFIYVGGKIDPDFITEHPKGDDITVAADSGILNAKRLGDHIDVAVGDFDSFPEREIPEDAYVDSCFIGICDNLVAIDAEIEKHSSGWRVDRISGVSLAILRLATYEMLYCDPKLPYSIAINEAVELAKRYDTDEAPAFINGVLNSVARSLGDSQK